jgi:hypothetical protein
MFASLRTWTTTGALFLMLLPTLPLDLARVEGRGEACSKRGGSCCRLMMALEGHYDGPGQLSAGASACAEKNCSVSDGSDREGTPAERSATREAVQLKGAPDRAATPPDRQDGTWTTARREALPSSPTLDILVPPPQPLSV